jgi:hypothetical protein
MFRILIICKQQSCEIFVAFEGDIGFAEVQSTEILNLKFCVQLFINPIFFRKSGELYKGSNPGFFTIASVLWLT